MHCGTITDDNVSLHLLVRIPLQKVKALPWVGIYLGFAVKQVLADEAAIAAARTFAPESEHTVLSERVALRNRSSIVRPLGDEPISARNKKLNLCRDKLQRIWFITCDLNVSQNISILNLKMFLSKNFRHKELSCTDTNY